jgi:two-component system, OmpR family, alkaline phosphatase synthesis response regulator PhoP
LAAPRILLVEDAEEISSLLDYLLQRAGFSVALARDGKQALDYIEREPPPDLAILDILLPYFSGFELVEKIRASATWMQVPIVMLTAKSLEKDIVRALELGANDYILKPFQPNEVIARLKRFLRSPA